MKTTNISIAKYNNLSKVELPKDVVNTEGKLLLINLNGREKVFKHLHITSGPIFANKLYTIEMLNEYKELLPSEFVLPDSLISVKTNINGFTMPYIRGLNLSTILSNPDIPNKEKIEYLKKVGEVLEKLNHIRKKTSLDNVFVNDLHADNILVDENKEIKFIDLDSCRISDNKPFPSKYLSDGGLISHVSSHKYQKFNKKVKVNDGYNYRRGYGFYEANENTDLYCYVIMILNFLLGTNVNIMSVNEFYDYITYLNYIGVDSDLLSAFTKITDNCNNVNPMNELDTLNNVIIARANKHVYNYIKNKK